MFEEIARGKLQELLARADSFGRGEVTMVIGGAEEAAVEAPADLDAEIAELQGQGMHTRQIADDLAAKHGLPRREVYRRIVRGAGHTS